MELFVAIHFFNFYKISDVKSLKKTQMELYDENTKYTDVTNFSWMKTEETSWIASHQPSHYQKHRENIEDDSTDLYSIFNIDEKENPSSRWRVNEQEFIDHCNRMVQEFISPTLPFDCPPISFPYGTEESMFEQSVRELERIDRDFHKRFRLDTEKEELEDDDAASVDGYNGDNSNDDIDDAQVDEVHEDVSLTIIIPKPLVVSTDGNRLRQLNSPRYGSKSPKITPRLNSFSHYIEK